MSGAYKIRKLKKYIAQQLAAFLIDSKRKKGYKGFSCQKKQSRRVRLRKITSLEEIRRLSKNFGSRKNLSQEVARSEESALEEQLSEENKSTKEANWDYLDTEETVNYLESKHRQELEKSCIDSKIISLNFKSLSGDNTLDYLLYSSKIPRTNTGRVSAWVLRRYAHCVDGGWWVDGVDVTGGGTTLWGSFKPDNPRFDEGKSKYIKYEHPFKIPTEIFALRISADLWQQIARRYNVELPQNYEEVAKNPYIFWQWVLENSEIPLIITEGAKKAAAILSCGYVAIALPGITSGYRVDKTQEEVKRNLIPQLQIFATPQRCIYFCFDQDSKKSTRQNVNNAISKTGKLFKRYGCEVHILCWNKKLGKGIDDVLYKSLQQGIEPKKQFSSFYRQALSFDDWESKLLKELTYPVNVQLNRRYLLNEENPSDTLPPQEAQLICLKAPKGTGKTHWMRWFCEPLLESGEKRVLLLTHRIQLSTQTADRIGIPYITEVKTCETKNLLGQGMCIDSLHPNSQARFNAEYWGNTYLIIDEAVQVFWHLLDSSTCKNERVMIIKTLKQLLINIIRSGGKIIIADADLSDVAIDFIKGLIGWEINTFIIENEYKFDEAWNIFNFQDKDARRLITLLKQNLNKGEKHLLCVSGQKPQSRWGSTNLEAYLLEKSFSSDLPDLKILRIDSETVANPNHPACGCVSKINEIIKDYDLVIATSTIETGVSIEEQHFDGVWGIFQGVSTTDSVRQFLSRYRVPVPRYIWLKETGIGFIGNKTTNFKSLIVSQTQLDKSNRKRLQNERNRLIDCGFEETVDGNFEPIALKTWAKFGAIINQGKWNYRSQVLADLEEEGHNLINIEKDADSVEFGEGEKLILPKSIDADITKDEVDKSRDKKYEEHRNKVAQADSLDDIAYEKLQRRQLRTEEELLQLRKGRLERSYCIEVTPELVEKDDEGWYSKIQLYYFWKVNPKYLRIREEAIIMSALKRGNQNYFIPDTNKRFLGRKVDMLYFLGVDKLYQEEKLDTNHPQILEIFFKCRDNLATIKLLLGIDLSKITSPIQCVQRILSLIGHKMPFISKQGRRGEQVRVYGTPAADFEYEITPEGKKKIVLDKDKLPISKPDGREEVFAGWLKRDALIQEKIEAQEQEKLYWSNFENVAQELEKIQSQLELHQLLDLRFKANDKSLAVIEAALELLPLQLQTQLSQWLWNWEKWEVSTTA